MATPLVTEGMPIPAYWDETGYHFGRRFYVTARTQLDAYAVLFSEKGVTRGTPFTDGVSTNPLYCVCTALTAEQRSQPGPTGTGLFIVTAIYGFPKAFQRQPVRPDGTVRYRTENGLTAAPIDRDKNGNALVNTAGQPFAGLSTTIPRIILVGEWITTGPDYANVFGRICTPYFNKVNGSVFQSADVNCLKCIGVDINEANIPGLSGSQLYWSVAVRWEFRQQVYVRDIRNYGATGWHGGWRRIIPNLGREKRKLLSGNERVQITDANGQPVTRDVYLTTAGGGELYVGPTDMTPCVIYDEFLSADFNTQVVA